jgi:hypothetical protein
LASIFVFLLFGWHSISQLCVGCCHEHDELLSVAVEAANPIVCILRFLLTACSQGNQAPSSLHEAKELFEATSQCVF